MKITDLEKYKHDTIGKFPMLRGLIETFEEHDYTQEDNAIIFQAIHEVLVKMVTTSKNLMEGPLKQGTTLTVLNDEVDPNLKKLELADVNVRYKLSNKKMDYYYFQSENSESLALNIEKLKLVLPITQIIYPSSEV